MSVYRLGRGNVSDLLRRSVSGARLESSNPPVECIYKSVGEDRETVPNPLFIHPDDCIDRGACEPACPWHAMCEEAAVPEVCSDDLARTYLVKDHVAAFTVPPRTKTPHRSADELEANKDEVGPGERDPEEFSFTPFLLPGV